MKSRNVSVSDLGPAALKQVREQLVGQAKVEKPAKYRNVRTSYKSKQGFERLYDSKKEANYAAELDLDPSVKWWIPQPSFPLPGGVMYRADFLVCRESTEWGAERFEKIDIVDVKGKMTQGSANKIKMVFALYGITVVIV